MHSFSSSSPSPSLPPSSSPSLSSYLSSASLSLVSSSISSSPSSTPQLSHGHIGPAAPTGSGLLQLPKEVWGRILEFADLDTGLSLCVVNRHAFAMLWSRDNRIVWQGHIAQHYPGMPVCPSTVAQPAMASNFRDKTCVSCHARYAPFNTHLLGRWCKPCTKKKWVGNSSQRFEVRIVLARTPPSLKHGMTEYSLAKHARTGRRLWRARVNGGAEEHDEWVEWCRSMRAERAFGERLVFWWKKWTASLNRP
ncbi:hypothetical protein RhiJN_16077 [Ceratobasidium sp. AG-Ba]|nr:hypothetical protein RhiJN_16077 [Ceratobasidium sp. AG-Ba]